MSDRAWMPLYIGDYLADTQHLTAAENGAYLFLIMHYWRNGGLPADDEMRRRISRMTGREWGRSKTILAGFFDEDWRHKRIDCELEKVRKTANVRSIAGKLGGRAKALKQQEATLANATILLTHSQSHSQSQETTSPISSSSVSKETSSELVIAACDDPRRPRKKIERGESDEKLLDQITDLWNAWARTHNCPQVTFLSKKRGQQCRNRLAEFANGDEPLTLFRKILAKCEQSFFVRGMPRSRLRFNQLMQEGFLIEMLEGGYDYQPGRQSCRR